MVILVGGGGTPPMGVAFAAYGTQNLYVCCLFIAFHYVVSFREQGCVFPSDLQSALC